MTDIVPSSRLIQRGSGSPALGNVAEPATESPLALPPALTGVRRTINTASAGVISYYAAGPDHPAGGHRSEPPLLLIHSVNAAASAYEMKPLYEHFRQRRPVYAIDLPGFGFSERRDIDYSPRMMTDAVLALTAEIAGRHGAVAIDAMALSLSTEFLARAAMEVPQAFRSLALISPTGLESRHRHDGEAETTREVKLLSLLMSFKPLGRALFALLSRPRVIRYFLQRTWGSRQINEGLWHYSKLSAAQHGARHAPLRFVALALFSADISRVHDALRMPVWLAHGVRGDFTRYVGAERLEKRPNWRIDVFQTGAMPHFELQRHFLSCYKQFLQRGAVRVQRAALSRTEASRPAPAVSPVINQRPRGAIQATAQRGSTP